MYLFGLQFGSKFLICFLMIFNKPAGSNKSQIQRIAITKCAPLSGQEPLCVKGSGIVHKYAKDEAGNKLGMRRCIQVHLTRDASKVPIR